MAVRLEYSTTNGGGHANMEDMVLDSENNIVITGFAAWKNIFDSDAINVNSWYPDMLIAKINQPQTSGTYEIINGESNFSVYPNPSTNNFYLNIFLSEKDALEIKIYDVNGKTVYSEKLKEFEGEFNKNIEFKNSQGVYFIEAVGEKNRFTKKLIQN